MTSPDEEEKKRIRELKEALRWALAYADLFVRAYESAGHASLQRASLEIARALLDADTRGGKDAVD